MVSKLLYEGLRVEDGGAWGPSKGVAVPGLCVSQLPWLCHRAWSPLGETTCPPSAYGGPSRATGEIREPRGQHLRRGPFPLGTSAGVGLRVSSPPPSPSSLP